MSAVLINGQAALSVAHNDRGLQYGDGVFETISCRHGKPRWLPLHLERLRTGLQRLQLPFEQFDALQNEIAGLSQAQPQCLIKVIVTRGVATRRGYAPDGNERPTRIVSRHDWPAAQAPADIFRVGMSEVPLGNNRMLAGIKHLNRLEQVLAQIGCVANGLDEVLMTTTTGQIISGSMSNVFFADETGLFTPDLSECGIEGIMRRVVLQCAASADIAIRVGRVMPGQLDTVREVFVTNVRWGLQSVGRLQGRTLSSAAQAHALQRVIDETYP